MMLLILRELYEEGEQDLQVYLKRSQEVNERVEKVFGKGGREMVRCYNTNIEKWNGRSLHTYICTCCHVGREKS